MQVFNPNENQFTTYVNNPNTSNSISNNYVIDILIQNDTCVWVATSDGLNRFNPLTKTFVNYFERNGLPNNLINALALDQEGKLWVSTGNGLCWFDYKNNTFTNFNKTDGLQGDEFTDRSILTLTTNKIFVGGVNGFNIISPQKIQVNAKIPNVVITDLTIFNQKVPIGIEGGVLTKQISETKVLNLSYTQSVLTFYFAALDFTIPLKNQYAYMMEGFDTDWIYCGNRTDATYTNLNPGKYIFRVKGSNNDGVWNETGTALEIIISPPWWKTKLALFSFGLFIIGMFLLFYFYRINSLKAQQKLLEKLVNERTNELSELNTELEETNEEVFQQKEELLTQADILSKTNKKLEKSSEELKHHKNNLEETVKIRTAELEKSKEKAEESDRLKSAFLANMSHEIRTPMNAIVGFSNLLNQPDLDENTKNNYVTQINENTASLCTLIDDILDISLMESNILLIKKNEFEINILLDEVFLDATIQNPKSEIRLSNQIENLQLMLFTDRFRLKQVLMNLINNGCKFTESGYVELGCYLKDNELVLFVKDTGIGISSENLEIIFDRFRKVLDDKTKLFRGVGLGLAISKKIAELLQGQLTCESELGIGSVFSLVLPNTLISTLKVEEPVPVKSNILNLEHKTILIVEDEETNYLYLESALKPTHATIVWAHDGKMALDLFLSAQQFHLVLMDIKMPRMNGYDATIAIKEMFPNQLIVAQTAYARPQDSIEIKQAGFDDYLIKPIIPDDLYRLLNKFF
jgi:signal transduction histidine kinase/CheY-like chemotaxis protein